MKVGDTKRNETLGFTHHYSSFSLKKQRNSEKYLTFQHLDTEAATLVDCDVYVAATVRKQMISWIELNWMTTWSKSLLHSNQDVVAWQAFWKTLTLK